MRYIGVKEVRSFKRGLHRFERVWLLWSWAQGQGYIMVTWLNFRGLLVADRRCCLFGHGTHIAELGIQIVRQCERRAIDTASEVRNLSLCG